MASSDDCGERVRLLVGAGADPATTHDGESTLLVASGLNDNASAVLALLEALPPGSADSADGVGRTPLARAVRRGSFAVVKALLAAGADPETPSEGNFGPSTPFEVCLDPSQRHRPDAGAIADALAAAAWGRAPRRAAERAAALAAVFGPEAPVCAALAEAFEIEAALPEPSNSRRRPPRI